jgi:hypothetical protein
MARARNIKPGFFTNELLGTYDPIISLLFAGLWCLADKDGILEDRPLRIKAELFPYREGLDVNGYLTVLERDAFLTRYKVGGVGYIQIKNFAKHQTPHHTEKARGYPDQSKADPDQSKEDRGAQGKEVLTPLCNGEKTVPTRSDSLIPDSLIPDSLIPDSLIPDSGFTDWGRAATATASRLPKAKRKQSLPENFEPKPKHLELAASLAVNLIDEFPQFCDHHIANGSLMASWDAALSKWIRNAAKWGGKAGESKFMTAQQRRDENNRRSTAEFLGDDVAPSVNTIDGEYRHA